MATSSRGAGLLAACLLAACGEPDLPPPSNQRRPPGIDLSAIDRSVSPCRDFYQFACGRWLARNPLDAQSSYVSTGFDAYYAQVEPLRQIIRDASQAGHTFNSPEMRLIGAYHQGCLDAPSDSRSRGRLLELARTVDPIASLDDLARVVAAQAQVGSSSLFWMYLSANQSDPSRYVLTIGPGGRELPDRDYYLEAGHASLRERYQQHIRSLAARVGVSIDPGAVLAIETALAMADLSPAERRDPRSLHHPMSFEALTALAPRFPWRTYFTARGFAPEGQVDVVVPSYLMALDALLGQHSLESLKDYLRWQIIEDKAEALDQPVLDEEFSFHDRLFGGRSEPSSRDWTCYVDTVWALGFALSRSYVPRFVDPGVRSAAQEMLRGVRAAMRQRLGAATWLDDQTRAEAIGKLDRIVEKIAYPDVWPESPVIDLDGTWLDVRLRMSQASAEAARAWLARPVDRSIWYMPPITVNAYYDPSLNDIVFPAGILRLPYFDRASGAAANFGAIGSVMGHEITHAFDDMGRQFDGEGRLRNWWSPAVEATFQERSRCLIGEIERHYPLPGRRVDGVRTLGENIADLGGIQVAFDAWVQSGALSSPMGGYDGAQQFFIAHAQTYCMNVRDELASTWLDTDSHSPSRLRVNSPLSQLESFAQAFQCPADSPMRVRPACEIW